MTSAHYFFTHDAIVDAPASRVAEVLVDLEFYPTWWPQVRAVASLGPDDAWAICRSALPYHLELHLTALRRDPEHLEVAIDGPIRGFARWQLGQSGAGTALHFTQEVEAQGALAVASRVLRPLLTWNHEVMMRGCVQGLRDALASPA